MTVLEYIKNSIDILIDLKVQEKTEFLKKTNLEDEEEKQNEYESLLRKLEGDIRTHIRVKIIIAIYFAFIDGTSAKASL